MANDLQRPDIVSMAIAMAQALQERGMRKITITTLDNARVTVEIEQDWTTAWKDRWKI